MSENPECAVCYQPIDEFNWYVQVRRQDNPFHVRLAHHTCPPPDEDDPCEAKADAERLLVMSDDLRTSIAAAIGNAHTELRPFHYLGQDVLRTYADAVIRELDDMGIIPR